MDAHPSFAEELRALETKLKERKEKNIETGVVQHERQVFRDVVKEHAMATQVPQVPSSAAATDATPVTVATGPIPKDRERHIEELVTLAFTSGIGNAITKARKAGDPYLLDLLHDRLADAFYDKLIAARRVNER